MAAPPPTTGHVPAGLSGARIRWKDIDERIRPLVRALNAPERGIVTLGSCCGHQRKGGYIDLAVHSIEGARMLVALMHDLQAAAPELRLDAAFNWSDDVATACDFEEHPDWLMFSLQLGDEAGPPTTAELALLATAARAYFGT